ncbi:MAG: DNA polymerase III subunit delta [Candidatus Phytoplasma cynodontis]|nr:MAG: DNA polymerase III subunit delta [Candidatus Phytoplasma cynodontis]
MRIYNLNLFFYKQDFFKENKKNILKKFCDKNNYFFVNYKLEKENYKNIIQNIEQELYTSSFFFNKKIIFIENISLLFNNENKNHINLEFLFNYFSNPRKDIYLCLTEKKDIFPLNIKKKLEKNFFIHEFNQIETKELISYISNLFQKDNFIIKKRIIYKIIEKTYGNLLLLNQEINKIKIYFHDIHNKNINDEEDIIEELVYSENKNIFLLINSILEKNKLIENFFLFKKLIHQKQNFTLTINQILKKMKDIILIKNLIKQKKNKYKITHILNLSINEIEFLISKTKKIDTKKIKNLFLFFIKIFYEIKKKKILNKKSLEIFILIEIIRNKFF